MSEPISETPPAKPAPNAPQANARRTARARIGDVPIRFILPNVLTLIALCAGLTAIRFAFEGRYDYAVLAIATAAVLDGLDGCLARAIKGVSRFGAELDSLADFIDFGVAPAFMLYVLILHDVKGLGWFAALIFAIACALRLARFNVMIEDPDQPAWKRAFFLGMPAPAGALVGLLPVYWQLLELPRPRGFITFEIIYVLAIAGLMVSRIPHFSSKMIGRVPRQYVPLVLVLAVGLIVLLAIYPLTILMLLALLYLGLLPLSVRRYNRLSRAYESPAKASG